MRLQTQLILSHLFVTIISVMILVIGLLVGYWIYLQTPLPAAWAGDWAEVYASEVEIELEANCPECVTFILEDAFFPVSESPEFDEWLIVIDTDGVIIDSNYQALYPTGGTIWDQLPFGVSNNDFQLETTTYGNRDDRHFALTSLSNNQGWVYFHGGSIDTAFQLQQTIQITLIASAALGVIAVIVSGAMGGWLGYFFGRRLTILGRVSAAVASGNLTQRVPITGKDELNQLGLQFNHMADTIGRQITDLHQLAETNARLATEAEGLARLEERNRLARELHDAVKQQLFGLNLTLGSIPPLLTSKPTIAQQRIQQVIEQTQAVQVELDQIIKQIRPASLQDQGLGTAVRQLAQSWSEQTAVATTVDIEHERALPLQIEQTLYRITQEALQNIGKHAQANMVKIDVQYGRDTIALNIQDDGVGFDINQVNPQQSFGLQNMHQRTADLQGTFTIKSTPNGTHIKATLPLQPQSLTTNH